MSDSFSCRSCGTPGATVVLSLGQTPLANALLRADQLDKPETKYPLDLAYCAHCSLVQITEVVPPEQLFREYLYFSSFSDTVLEHARSLAWRLIGQRGLNEKSLVVEVASNDGYLLQHYARRNIPVLGIEPARNVARVARETRGIATLSEFFDEKLARQLRDEGKQADVIHANNVLAHVADVNGFMAGIGLLLKPGGVAVVEVPYVCDMIDHVEFDTIYHEHLWYFSLTSLRSLLQRHGLLVMRVEHIPVHGGSLRLFIEGESADGCVSEDAASVQQMLEEESRRGVDRLEFYQGFGIHVAKLRNQLVTLLRGLKAQGKRIAAYGASAKGTTLLSYCGVGRETLDFVVDRSTFKQGYYTPGTHLQIYPLEKLREAMPDYVLLLTWNFADEILSQQDAYLRRGGRFIIPIPEPRIAGGALVVGQRK